MVVEAVLVLFSLTRMGKSSGRAAVDDEAGRRMRSRVSRADLVEENSLGADELCLIRISTCKSCCVGPFDRRDKKARWMVVVEVLRQERVASKKFR